MSFAVLPIGDFFTMGIDDAIRAADFVNVKKVVGVHYNTFPPIEIDPESAINTFRTGGQRTPPPEDRRDD